MKLVSPFQRGTTCTCRCSRHAGPRHAALVEPDVEAVGLVGAPQSRAHADLDQRHDARPSSAGVASSRAPPCAGDGGHQMAGGVREGVEDEEGLLATAQDERAAIIAAASASQKTQPPAADEGRPPATDDTYGIRHGAQSRSTRLRGGL